MNFCLVPFKNWFNFLIEIIYLNPNKAGLFEGSFFCDGGPNDPSLIFQEELIQYHIFKVDWKWKKCWHHLSSYVTSYMTSLVYLQQRNFKKSKKSLKIVEEENLHIFWTTWGISKKLSGKMYLVMIFEVTKNQGFTHSLEKTVF